MRQAVAHALDREGLLRALYPPGAQVARQLMPPTLWGYAKDAPGHPFDPARARQLLAGAGVTSPAVELSYPTGVTDPIWVDTAAIAAAFKADLEDVGFQVTLKPMPFRPDYLATINAGSGQLLLVVAYGDRGDPDAVLGSLQRPSRLLGFDSPELSRLLDQAEAEPDEQRRRPLYEQANRVAMELLPAVPYVHVPVYVAVSKKVRGHAHGPVPWDPYALISLAD